VTCRSIESADCLSVAGWTPRLPTPSSGSALDMATLPSEASSSSLIARLFARGRWNQETLLRSIKRFSVDPIGDVLEVLRRLVVDIVLGNCDGHLKNWFFIYPDGRHPRLSPAYDIVSTISYLQDTMALRFYGAKDPSIVAPRAFAVSLRSSAWIRRCWNAKCAIRRPSPRSRGQTDHDPGARYRRGVALICRWTSSDPT
jgi:hypothetical protein